jgi:HPt (histidine-containing phosphotransfer) domain-containing protein
VVPESAPPAAAFESTWDQARDEQSREREITSAAEPAVEFWNVDDATAHASDSQPVEPSHESAAFDPVPVAPTHESTGFDPEPVASVAPEVVEVDTSAWAARLESPGPSSDPEVAESAPIAEAVRSEPAPVAEVSEPAPITESPQFSASSVRDFDAFRAEPVSLVPPAAAEPPATGSDLSLKPKTWEEARDASMVVTPILDPVRLDQSSMGNPELQKMLVQSFLTQVHPRLQRLREGVLLGDAEVVGFEAHALKGMCATLGALRCAEVFEHMERLAQQQRLEPLRFKMDRAESEVQQVEALLREPESRAA